MNQFFGLKPAIPPVCTKRTILKVKVNGIICYVDIFSLCSQHIPGHTHTTDPFTRATSVHYISKTKFMSVLPRQRSVPKKRKAGRTAKPCKKLQMSKQEYCYIFQMSRSWKIDYLNDLEKGKVMQIFIWAKPTWKIPLKSECIVRSLFWILYHRTHIVLFFITLHSFI